jgi:hypothetical protein
VKDAPEFSHSAYAVYAERSDNDVIHRVRQGLKQVATARDGGIDSPIAPRAGE